jgi:hypothetical protein
MRSFSQASRPGAGSRDSVPDRNSDESSGRISGGCRSAFQFPPLSVQCTVPVRYLISEAEIRAILVESRRESVLRRKLSFVRSFAAGLFSATSLTSSRLQISHNEVHFVFSASRDASFPAAQEAKIIANAIIINLAAKKLPTKANVTTTSNVFEKKAAGFDASGNAWTRNNRRERERENRWLGSGRKLCIVNGTRGIQGNIGRANSVRVNTRNRRRERDAPFRVQSRAPSKKLRSGSRFSLLICS